MTTLRILFGVFLPLDPVQMGGGWGGARIGVAKKVPMLRPSHARSVQSAFELRGTHLFTGKRGYKG